jgi:hypothetical protein
VGKLGVAEAALNGAVEQESQHAERDVGADLGVGVVEQGPELDDALDGLEILLDGVLMSVEAGDLGGVVRKFGMADQQDEPA